MALTASLVASQVSGPAPLFVFFDGTGTTSDEVSEGRYGGVFHQVIADFDYGDDDTAAWPYWADVETTETSGTMYAVITTSNVAPSDAQIAAGTDEGDAAAFDSWSVSLTQAGHFEHKVDGMTAGVRYYLYYVHDSGSATYGSVTTGLSHLAISKNTDRGAPLGQHVYDSPGSYTATITCTVDGQTSTDTVSITVTDPDTVYSGTDTIVVSSSGSYGTEGVDYPTGATTQTSVPSSTEVVGKRVLFKRGESFTLSKLDQGEQNTQYGAFGDVSLGYAELTWTDVTYTQGNGNGNWPTNVTFLEGVQFPAGFNTSFSMRHFLFDKVKFGEDGTNLSTLFACGNVSEFSARDSSSDTQAAYFWLPRNICVHECHMAASEGFMVTNIIAFLLWTDSAMAGTYINRNNTQCVRLIRGFKSIFQENRTPGKIVGNTRNIFKIQAQGPQDHTYDPVRDPNDGLSPWTGWYCTQYVVFRGGDFAGEKTSTAQCISASQPHSQANGPDSDKAELVQDVVIENTYTRTDENETVDTITAWGRRITARNNSTENNGGVYSFGTSAQRLEEIPDSWRVGRNANVDYDNKVSGFTIGEIVTGQTNNQTGEISSITDNGASGTLNLINCSGAVGTTLFDDNEVIIGDVAGEATVNEPSGLFVFRYAASHEAWCGPYYEYDYENRIPGTPVSATKGGCF